MKLETQNIDSSIKAASSEAYIMTLLNYLRNKVTEKILVLSSVMWTFRDIH